MPSRGCAAFWSFILECIYLCCRRDQPEGLCRPLITSLQRLLQVQGVEIAIGAADIKHVVGNDW